MGCDIHLFAEIKKKKNFKEKLQFWKSPKWQNVDKWSKNKYFDKWPEEEQEFTIANEDLFYSGGRNYNLFCALCNVRRSHFKGDIPCVSKPKGLPLDVSDTVRSESDRMGTDGHSHSYNTLKELNEFDWSEYGNTVKQFLDEVLPKMKAFGVGDEEVRIVYWFDN